MADLSLYEEFEMMRTTDFNPDTGTSLVIVYAAIQSKLEEIKAYYDVAGYVETPIGYGYKTSLSNSGAACILTVRIPDDILYTEKWNLASSPEQIPIWRDLKVREYCASTLGTLNLTTDPGGINLQTFMWRVMSLNRSASLVQSGIGTSNVFTPITPSGGVVTDLGAFTEEELQVIFQIVREGPYMDWKRPVLKRQRYIPSVNLLNRTRLVGRAELYSLDGIASVFGIPDDIYDQAVTVYNDLPAAYPNTEWSWKMGRDDSEGIVGAAKVLECKEWTFGLWSTITNDFIE